MACDSNLLIESLSNADIIANTINVQRLKRRILVSVCKIQYKLRRFVKRVLPIRMNVEKLLYAVADSTSIVDSSIPSSQIIPVAHRTAGNAPNPTLVCVEISQSIK